MGNWWRSVETKRKFLSVVIAILTIYAGYKISDLGLYTLLLVLVFPVHITRLLWTRKIKPPFKKQRPPKDIKKRIILFSDGTGNSSSKLFKTNVWRLYQSIDFGYTQSRDIIQIGNYNDGVGTSAVKIVALLGGIFGLGLRRNVVELYRFLCRNYAPGDEIFVFGFSRGAFTVRILAALIASQGVISKYQDERHLARLTNEAYRNFVRNNKPEVFPYITIFLRGLRDFYLRFYDWLIDPKPVPKPPPVKHHYPEIEFVGVWDTVGAYGGPIMELTRGIDRWVAPLSMTDYMLSGKVKKARHALALDDERASFRPLVWDEVHESAMRNERGRLEELLKDGSISPSEKENAEKDLKKVKNFVNDRIKQVWFSGMHADVGGGYPDESLSYVSLLWMIDELDQQIQFLPLEVERYRKAANIFGRIHDSRRGAGSYYRYQPRKISALMHHGGRKEDISRSLSLRVPETIRKYEMDLDANPKLDSKGKPIIKFEYGGLLTHCRVHSSVLVRIATGTDKYAPIGLPSPLFIEPGPEKLSAEDEKHLLQPDGNSYRTPELTTVWDVVVRRRVVYFAALFFTLFFAAMPLWSGYLHEIDFFRNYFAAETTGKDERWIGGFLTGPISSILPDFAKIWLDEFDKNPFVFLILLGFIFLLMTGGTSLERSLRDGSRQLWWEALKGETKEEGPIIRFRHKYSYQRGLQIIRWSVSPTILGFLSAASIFGIVGVFIAQTGLLIAERNGSLCHISEMDAPNPDATIYKADGDCHDTGMDVEEGKKYQIVLAIPDKHPKVTGIVLNGFSSWVLKEDAPKLDLQNRTELLFGAPIRRSVSTNWLQPLYLVRQNTSIESGNHSEKIGDNVLIKAMKFQPTVHADGTTTAVAEIEAPFRGRLFLFANDLKLPWLENFACNISGVEACKIDVHLETTLLE